MSSDDTIKALKELNEQQAGQISALLLHVVNLEGIIEKQAEQILTLTTRVENVEQELSFYKNRKNSGNSHLPPSIDLVKRNQSLRESSDKKAGGQKGHEGSTLKFSATPNHIVNHIPTYCQLCGNDLEQTYAVSLNRRQVIDIPMPATVCTEHRTFAKTCSCGHINKGEFPQGNRF